MSPFVELGIAAIAALTLVLPPQQITSPPSPYPERHYLGSGSQIRPGPLPWEWPYREDPQA
jgi:hypothetical protein